jgi:predicted nuclease of predicted toxin-antitoxin system
MWLLDVNLPNGLIRLLQSYGIPCATAARRGWRDLTNGALAEAAFREGFRVILTRDRLFGTSARRALAALPELGIVVVTLSQTREETYLAEFATQWRRKPIEPVAGAVVEWP